MDGAHTHGHGPSGLAELVVLAFGVVLAADIVAMVSQDAFSDLRAAPRMVTPPHTPVPFSPILEDAYVPDPDTIAAAIRKTAGAPASA